MTDRPPLTPGDLEVLEFERHTEHLKAGPKATAIRERFYDSDIRYYQRLGHIITHPDAAAYDPQLVNRLLRIRETKRLARTHAGRDALDQEATG